MDISCNLSGALCVILWLQMFRKCGGIYGFMIVVSLLRGTEFSYCGKETKKMCNVGRTLYICKQNESVIVWCFRFVLEIVFINRYSFAIGIEAFEVKPN